MLMQRPLRNATSSLRQNLHVTGQNDQIRLGPGDDPADFGFLLRLGLSRHGQIMERQVADQRDL